MTTLICDMSKFDYSTVEQNTLKFLESLQGPPLYTLTPNDARTVLSGLQSKSVQKLPAEIEDHIIPNGPNGELKERPTSVSTPGISYECLALLVFLETPYQTTGLCT